jgi:ribosomal protein L11 methyltransferase
VVTAETGSAQAETLETWCRETLGVEPVRLEKPDDPRAWIELYFPDEVRALLAGRLLADRPGVRGVSTRAVRPRDWQGFWKHHFPVTRVGRLRLVPLWERRKVTPRRGTIDLVINPGLSFGTGTHFTTRYCLEALSALCAGRRKPESLLDIGFGSGILAIAAVRLGIREVRGMENDPQAVALAERNARLNGLRRRIRWIEADITRDPPGPPCEVVVANLFGHLLASCAAPIAAAAGRHIILSGIREHEADYVAGAFAAQRWMEVERDGDGDWCGLRLERSAGA